VGVSAEIGLGLGEDSGTDVAAPIALLPSGGVEAAVAGGWMSGVVLSVGAATSGGATGTGVGVGAGLESDVFFTDVSVATVEAGYGVAVGLGLGEGIGLEVVKAGF